MDITASAQWSELAKVYEGKKDLNLRELFAADADRARNFTFDAAGLHVDRVGNELALQGQPDRAGDGCWPGSWPQRQLSARAPS